MSGLVQLSRPDDDVVPSSDLSPEEWDRFVLGARGGTIFQSWDWGEARRAGGWNLHRILVRDAQERPIGAAQVGVRRHGPWTIAYCQRGPVWSDTAGLRELLAAMTDLACREGAVFLKLNPDLEAGDPDLSVFRQEGYRSVAGDAYAHRATFRLHLDGDETTLLQRMEGRTRRAIARSARERVIVDSGSDPLILARGELLLRTTARRRSFAAPSGRFLEDLRARLGSERFRVRVARIGPVDLAAAIHLVAGRRCSYLWGGSRSDRTLPSPNASAAIQWSAIQEALARGIDSFDLHGVPLDRRGAPAGGISLFKRGFGGVLVRLVGDLDLVLKPVRYLAWRCGEGLYLRRKRRGGR